MTRDPIIDVLYRVKRGLAGYVSYLAACEMNQSFSEYLLYEPTLRILSAQGWSVECEHPCPGYQKQGAGDHKKIDFVANKNETSFAIEMKWAKKSKINIDADIEKLRKYIQANNQARGFLTIFGKKSDIETLNLSNHHLIERGKQFMQSLALQDMGAGIMKSQQANYSANYLVKVKSPTPFCRAEQHSRDGGFRQSTVRAPRQGRRSLPC